MEKPKTRKEMEKWLSKSGLPPYMRILLWRKNERLKKRFRTPRRKPRPPRDYRELRIWAQQQTQRAVRAGVLPNPRISTLACADCGKRADRYDHRDYFSPLDVQPVCCGCNGRRGPGYPGVEWRLPPGWTPQSLPWYFSIKRNIGEARITDTQVVPRSRWTPFWEQLPVLFEREDVRRLFPFSWRKVLKGMLRDGLVRANGEGRWVK